jgi:hypothetical protein
VSRTVGFILAAVVMTTAGGCREKEVPGAGVRGPDVDTEPGDVVDGGAAAMEVAMLDTAADAGAAEAGAMAEAGAEGGAPPIDEGLVGWWRFDEANEDRAAAGDSSGRGNDGMLVDVPATASIVGRQGRALDLKGAGVAHVRVPSSVSINGIYRAFTVTAFIQQATSGPDRATILARQAGYVLGLTAGRPYVAITVAAGAVPVELAATAPIATGRWVHVAATFDGGAARLFLDGKPVGSLAVSTTIGNSNVPVTIGARLQGTTVADPLGASLDEVRLYARALSAAELAALATPD